MNTVQQIWGVSTVGLMLSSAGAVYADSVDILAANMQQHQEGYWLVSVTLKHADSGWDHYADRWRLVDSQNKVLGERVLLHPHVDEQPFTRSLSRVEIPASLSTVYIEAHDKLAGWAPMRLKIDLDRAIDGELMIE